GATPYATVSSRISQHFKRAAEHKPPRTPLLAKAVDERHSRKIHYYLAANHIVKNPSATASTDLDSSSEFSSLGSDDDDDDDDMEAQADHDDEEEDIEDGQVEDEDDEDEDDGVGGSNLTGDAMDRKLKRRQQHQLYQHQQQQQHINSDMTLHKSRGSVRKRKKVKNWTITNRSTVKRFKSKHPLIGSFKATTPTNIHPSRWRPNNQEYTDSEDGDGESLDDEDDDDDLDDNEDDDDDVFGKDDLVLMDLQMPDIEKDTRLPTPQSLSSFSTPSSRSSSNTGSVTAAAGMHGLLNATKVLSFDSKKSPPHPGAQSGASTTNSIVAGESAGATGMNESSDDEQDFSDYHEEMMHGDFDDIEDDKRIETRKPASKASPQPVAVPIPAVRNAASSSSFTAGGTPVSPFNHLASTPNSNSFLLGLSPRSRKMSMSGLLMPPDSLLLSPRSNSIFDSEFNFFSDFSNDISSPKEHQFTPLTELKNPESMPVSELDRLLSTSGGGSLFPSLSRKVSIPGWSNINAKHLGHTPHRHSNLRNTANGILQNAANSNASTSPYLGSGGGTFAPTSPSLSATNGTKNTAASATLQGSTSVDKQSKIHPATSSTSAFSTAVAASLLPAISVTPSNNNSMFSETPSLVVSEEIQDEELDDETESELEDDETLSKTCVEKSLVAVAEYENLKVYETIMPGTDLKLMRVAGTVTALDSIANGGIEPVQKKVIPALNNEHHAGFVNATMLRLAARTTIGDGQFDINQERTTLYIVLEGPMEVRGAWVNLERARELCREYRLDLLPGISQMLQENPLESAKTKASRRLLKKAMKHKKQADDKGVCQDDILASNSEDGNQMSMDSKMKSHPADDDTTPFVNFEELEEKPRKAHDDDVEMTMATSQSSSHESLDSTETQTSSASQLGASGPLSSSTNPSAVEGAVSQNGAREPEANQLWIPTINPVTPSIHLTVIDNVALYTTKLVNPGAEYRLLRRADNGYVNATTLLLAGGVETEQERSIVLSLELGRVRVRKPGSQLFGTWIPLARARALAATCSLHHKLGPFLNDNLDTYFPSPLPIPTQKVTPSVVTATASALMNHQAISSARMRTISLSALRSPSSPPTGGILSRQPSRNATALAGQGHIPNQSLNSMVMLNGNQVEAPLGSAATTNLPGTAGVTASTTTSIAGANVPAAAVTLPPSVPVTSLTPSTLNPTAGTNLLQTLGQVSQGQLAAAAQIRPLQGGFIPRVEPLTGRPILPMINETVSAVPGQSVIPVKDYQDSDDDTESDDDVEGVRQKMKLLRAQQQEEAEKNFLKQQQAPADRQANSGQKTPNPQQQQQQQQQQHHQILLQQHQIQQLQQQQQQLLQQQLIQQQLQQNQQAAQKAAQNRPVTRGGKSTPRSSGATAGARPNSENDRPGSTSATGGKKGSPGKANNAAAAATASNTSAVTAGRSAKPAAIDDELDSDEDIDIGGSDGGDDLR
ncbi:hypothetical protein BGX34_000699, partial [Mortierella sp. NVP85]